VNGIFAWFLPRVGALVLGSAVALCGAEFALSRLDLGPISRVPLPNTVDRELRVHRVDEDPDIGWSLQPGASGELQGVEVSVNSVGCRGPEPRPRSPQRKLIISLGDSLPFGAGVPFEQTFSHLLSLSMPKVDVLNCGVSGYNLEQSLRRYRRDLAQLEPDIVLLNLWSDDLFPPYRMVDNSVPGWLRRRSALWRALDVAWFWSKELSFIRPPSWALDTGSYSDHARSFALNELREGKLRGIPALAVIHSTLYPLSDGRARAATPLKELAAEAGLPVLDLDPRYRASVAEDLSALSINPATVDPHLNPRGHRLAARALQERLEELGWLDSAASEHGEQ
jgi:hypothetical protein